MVRILVTGATGLLGTSLIPLLRARGYQVVGAARAGAVDAKVDLTDFERTREMLDSVSPEVIVNLAANTNVDACEADLHGAYSGNVRTVESLCRWLERAPARFLIHISTDQVYDGIGPHHEADIRLTNIYAFSKYAAELVAMRVPSAILRTNFFGWSRGSKKSFSDWIVQSAVAGTPIKVFTDILFSPVTIETLGRVIVEVVERRTCGVYNVGSHAGMSKADFAFSVARLLGLRTDCMNRAESREVALRAYRPKDMRMDVSKFESDFGVVLPTLQNEIESLRRDKSVRTESRDSHPE